MTKTSCTIANATAIVNDETKAKMCSITGYYTFFNNLKTYYKS